MLFLVMSCSNRFRVSQRGSDMNRIIAMRTEGGGVFTGAWVSTMIRSAEDAGYENFGLICVLLLFSAFNVLRANLCLGLWGLCRCQGIRSLFVEPRAFEVPNNVDMSWQDFMELGFANAPVEFSDRVDMLRERPERSRLTNKRKYTSKNTPRDVLIFQECAFK